MSLSSTGPDPETEQSAPETGLLQIELKMDVRRARLEDAPELARLRERVEDLEDARELDAAIRRNGDKPLLPWAEAKKDLGIV